MASFKHLLLTGLTFAAAAVAFAADDKATTPAPAAQAAQTQTVQNTYKVPAPLFDTKTVEKNAKEFTELKQATVEALQDAYAKNHSNFSPFFNSEFYKQNYVGRLENGKQAFLFLPNWDYFKPENFEELFRNTKETAEKEQAELKEALAKGELSPLDFNSNFDFESNARDSVFQSPVYALRQLLRTPEYSKAYRELYSKLSELSAKLDEDPVDFESVKFLYNHPDLYLASTPVRAYLQQRIDQARANGDLLDLEGKKALGELLKESTKLRTEFGENETASENSWAVFVPEADKAKLDGLPENTLKLLKQAAQERKKDQEERLAKGETLPDYEDKVTGEGYLVTQDYATFGSVLRFLNNREFRKQLWTLGAFTASPKDPTKGKFDNTPVVQKTYENKEKLADLLGYQNYAELALTDRAARSPQQVLEFLNDIRERALPGALERFNAVKAYAEKDGVKDFSRWDYSYYKAKLDKDTEKVDEEQFRDYLPADKVLAGYFAFVKKLYGVEFVEDKTAKTFHPDVKVYKVYDTVVDRYGKPVLDENGQPKKQLKAAMFFDLYSRPQKSSGAWAQSIVPYFETDDYVQLPVHLVVGNFTPPVKGQQALWTPSDVTTLFHEVGHALHGVLTRVPLTSLNGTNVEQDVVEFPSQFHENFFWEDEVLDLVTGHKDTGATMPKELREKLRKFRNLQFDPYSLYRQVFLATFDMETYVNGVKNLVDVHEKNLEVATRFDQAFWGPNRDSYFANQFGHIFQGGYAAGYYSYLWAEILAADAFAAFKENAAKTGTLLDPKLGRRFRNYVLEAGHVFSGSENFKRFRGRDADTTALLVQYGLHLDNQAPKTEDKKEEKPAEKQEEKKA